MGDSKDIPGRGKSKVRDVERNTWDCEWVNRWEGGGGEAGRQSCGSVMKNLVHLVEQKLQEGQAPCLPGSPPFPCSGNSAWPEETFRNHSLNPGRSSAGQARSLMLNQFLCQPAAISPFSRNTLRDSQKPPGNIGFSLADAQGFTDQISLPLLQLYVLRQELADHGQRAKSGPSPAFVDHFYWTPTTPTGLDVVCVAFLLQHRAKALQ